MEWEPSRLGETYHLRLSRLLVLTVTRDVQSQNNPSPTPYSAMVFGGRLKALFADADQAKAAAINLATRELEQAQAALKGIK